MAKRRKRNLTDEAFDRATEALRGADVRFRPEGQAIVLEPSGLRLVVSERPDGILVRVPSRGRHLIHGDPVDDGETGRFISAVRRLAHRHRDPLHDIARHLGQQGVRTEKRTRCVDGVVREELASEGRTLVALEPGKGRLLVTRRMDIAAAPLVFPRLATVSAFHAVVHYHYLPVLAGHVIRELGDPPPKILPEKYGRVMLNRDGAVCHISATTATITEGEPLPGRFLLPGAHWRRLAEAFQHAENRARVRKELEKRSGVQVEKEVEPEEDQPVETAPPPAAIEITITEPPPGIPAPLRERVKEASRRIRLERMTAYHFTALLKLGRGETIRFEPIVSSPRISAPFTHLYPGHAEIEGYVRLVGSSDPLWVGIRNAPTDRNLLGRTWALALLGFAALTCPLGRTALSTRTPSTRAGLSHAARRVDRSLPSRRFWSSELKMHVEHGQPIPHLVCAHRRLLQPGHCASYEAIQAAQDVGIELAADETWVRGHTRGGGTLTRASFVWSCPDVGYLPRVDRSAAA